MVLSTVEEAGVYRVCLQPPGQALDQLVVETATKGSRERGIGVRNTAAITDMSDSKESVRKRREPSDGHGSTGTEEHG